MILLQIMGARAELHQFAIVQAGSKTLGKAWRDEGAGIPGEKQLGICEDASAACARSRIA